MMPDLLAREAASVDVVQTVATRDGLAVLNDAGVELAIWERALPPAFRDWIGGVAGPDLPDFRILVSPDDLPRAVAPLLDDSGLAAGDMRDVLIADMQALVRTFADVTGTDLVDVRLDRIDHDACWKFHRDTVQARLVTTYRGAATEWVPLAHGEQAIADQKEYDGPLQRLADHDVALFKGNRAGPGSGVVHRSPPIAGTGQTRLLLCLNKPTEVSPAPWTPDRDGGDAG